MGFEILGEITEVETIATGRSIRELSRLRKTYGGDRWRKMKGKATIRLQNDKIRSVELHWYEVHGVGRKEMKIKRWLDKPSPS